MKKVAAISMIVMLLATIGCGQGAKQTAPVKDAKMLNLTLMDVNDRPIDLRKHFGKVVIIDFWDTWCGPCKREIPHFVELYDEYGKSGLEIVGVAFARQGKDAVRQFGEQYKINYTSALFNEEAQRLFGAPASIPTTFIIDQSGNVVEKIVGYRDKAYFEQRIKTLLKVS